MKEQIYSSKKLIGKTIADSAFINNIAGHELLFLIFNDDTFVCLETKENYNILSIDIGKPINIENFYYKDLINIGIITQD